jgi:hypothetical protein
VGMCVGVCVKERERERERERGVGWECVPVHDANQTTTRPK